MAPPTNTIGVYGATSFTAQTFLLYLDTHPDRSSFELIIAGRDRSKLEVAKETYLPAKGADVRAFKLGEEEAVRGFVGASSVIVNFAGPYALYNAEALVAECARTGTHYLDLSGEGGWIGDMVRKYHEAATASGAVIVPASGLDSVPSDLLVHVARETLRAVHPTATITQSDAFFTLRGTVSGGTVATFLAAAEVPPSQRRRGDWIMVDEKGPNAPVRLSRTVALFRTSTNTKDEKVYGGFYPMAIIDRPVVRRSWYLSKKALNGTDPHGTSTNDSFMYEEHLRFASKWKATLFSLSLYFFFLLFFTIPFVRTLVKRYGPQPGQGGSMEERRKGWFKALGISQSSIPDVQVVVRLKGEGCPGYLWTCYALAESALSLILPPPPGKSLPYWGQRGGLLTASTAVGEVFTERMKLAGKMNIEAEIVRSDRKKIQ